MVLKQPDKSFFGFMTLIQKYSVHYIRGAINFNIQNEFTRSLLFYPTLVVLKVLLVVCMYMTKSWLAKNDSNMWVTSNNSETSNDRRKTRTKISKLKTSKNVMVEQKFIKAVLSLFHQRNSLKQFRQFMAEDILRISCRP